MELISIVFGVLVWTNVLIMELTEIIRYIKSIWRIFCIISLCYYLTFQEWANEMCYDTRYSVTDLQRCPVKVQKSNHHFYNKTEFKNPRPRRIPPTKIITSVTSRVNLWLLFNLKFWVAWSITLAYICGSDASDVTLFQFKILMSLLLIINTRMKLSKLTYPFHLNTMDSSTIKLPFLLWATSLSSKIRMTLR